MAEYPAYNPNSDPRRAALLALLDGVDPSERPYSGPAFRLPERVRPGPAGPRFDPSAVSRGSYTGPQFSASRSDADARAYTGPQFSVRDDDPPEELPAWRDPSSITRTERPADADRVSAEPQRYPAWRGPSQSEPGLGFNLAAARAAVGQAPQNTGAGAIRAAMFDDSIAARGDSPSVGPATPASSAVEQDEARIRDLLSKAPANTNSRGMGALRLAAYGGAQEAQSDSLGRAIGGLAGGFGAGLLNKRADETIIDRPQQLARAQAQLQLNSAAEKARGEREAAQAGTREKNALAGYYEQKPWLEEQKRADAASQRERTVVLQNLRLRKGQPLDPNNPQDRALLERAASAGILVDPEEWNNSAGNNVTLTLTDPKDPTKTNTVLFNRVTKDETVVGQRGFQPTRDESGMTSFEKGSLGLRREEFNDRKKQEAIHNDFERSRISLAGQHLDLAKLARDDRLTTETRRELGSAARLRAQAEKAQALANDYADKGWYKDKDTGEMRRAKWAVQKETQAKEEAESLRSQLYDEYGYLWSPDGQGAPQMTMQDFRRNHPSFESSGHREGDKVVPMTTGDILAAARRYGITITDAGQPQTTPSAPGSNMPRRGAPGASRAPQSAAPAQSKGRVSRANFGRLRAQNPGLQGKSDAEVEAILKAQGIEVY